MADVKCRIFSGQVDFCQADAVLYDGAVLEISID